MHPQRPTAAALYALGTLFVSCLGRDALAQDAATRRAIADARHKGDMMNHALATLPPECVLGNARDADGTWVNASHARGVPSEQTAQEYALAKPVAGHVVRAAMDRQGWDLLDKVEMRDADGNWQLAWAGKQPAAPAQCGYVWYKLMLARDARIGTVRLVFRRENGSFTAGNLAVLKTAP